MTGYQTQQRNLLISFFESHPDEAFTIDEVMQRLQNEQRADVPSRSTVYRTVADLEKEGSLKRSYLSKQRRSAYQYHDAHACASHLHIRCEKCHTLMHLDTKVSDTIARLLQNDADVSLNVGNTVLLGCCKKCREQD